MVKAVVETAPKRGHVPPSSLPRVLLLDHTAVLGGAELTLLDLVRAFDRRACTPIVLLFSQGTLVDRLRDASVECHVLPLPESLVRARRDETFLAETLRTPQIAAFGIELARHIRNAQVDVVHTHSLKSHVLGTIAARMARVPAIWHIHERFDSKNMPTPVVMMFRALSRVMPHWVIANSKSTLETLRLSDKCQRSIVYSGVPRSLAEEEPSKAFSADAPRIGLIGRISPQKGQHVFIEAASQVLASFPKAQFSIVGAPLFGEQDYDSEIRALSLRLGLEGKVEFTGARDDAPQLMRKFDIIVQASTVGEGMGRVVVEAMAAGKPVIATSGGGTSEVVAHEDTGFIVPPADPTAIATAIRSLLSNPARAMKMGRRGRERMLEHFTIERSARAVERIYHRVCHSSRAIGAGR